MTTEETLTNEAEIVEEVATDTIVDEDETEETTDEVEETEEEEEEVIEPPKPKKSNKVAKILSEKNELKKENELIKLERDVALIKAKYGNDVDEAKIQEIKQKYKELSMEEVYAIYSHQNPKKAEEQPKQQTLKVVGNKPVNTKRTFTYTDLHNLPQAEYNKVLDQVKQGKAVIKSEI